MTVSLDLIKELRQRTGAGILACREALEATDGDIDKAVSLLREQGLAAAAKRADRATQNGVLDLYNHGDGRVGVIVEVNCETDFVARTDEFKHFAHEIALQVAAYSPRWLEVEDVPDPIIEEERQYARKWAIESGKPEHVLDRIVEGRLEKFFDENCLMRQTYIRNEEMTIAELLQEVIIKTGENVTIRRFARWVVGEELE
jgi:elongation factor Ts